MSASILTDIGAAQIAAAIESGTLPAWTQMALGDGGGEEVDLDPEVTALVNQVYIGDLNSITVDEDDNTRVVCEMLLDADSDDSYTIREFGIYDTDGNLVAYGSLPNIVKTAIDTDGTAIELVIRAVVAVGNADVVQLLLNTATYVTTDALDEALASIDTSNADTADALSTARTIAISGYVTGTATAFDGTANISIPVTNVSQADKLTTARTIRTNLASTSTASFNGTSNVTPGVTGTLAITNGGTGNTIGNAVTATALATARTIRTNLASTSTASFNGTANITPGVTGVLPITNGGTGNSTGSAATLGTSTVGSGKQPIYLSSGAATASTSTVGDSDTPVYLKSGVITACSSISEASAYKKATNGYIQFANTGIIMQWGYSTSANSGVTFPLEFPNAAWAAFVNYQGTSSKAEDNYDNNVLNLTTTGFNTRYTEICYWFAIGY